MLQTVRVSALQIHAEPRRYEENRQRVEEWIRKAAEHEPDILVMPEMFLHGHCYEKDRNDYKEPIEGPTLAWMKSLSKELNVMLLGGINEEIPGSELTYSTLLCVDGDELLGFYRKRNPASAELLFMKGGTESTILETRFGRIALITCFDMSIPECIVDAFSQRVDLILVANAWPEMEKMPYLAGQVFQHHTVLPRALAMQLRAPLCVANMVGPTSIIVPGLPAFGGGVYAFDTEFCGGSLICDHMGVVIDGISKEDGEGFIMADLNLEFSRGIRDVTLNNYGMDEMRSHIFKR